MRPEDLRYSKDHEWIRTEDGLATVGITDYAAGELGDIVFIELPDVGREVEAGESLGTIETVKAVEDIYAPVGGRICDVNAALEDKPELANEDPFGEGWLLQIENVDDAQAELMTAADYAAMIGESD